MKKRFHKSGRATLKRGRGEAPPSAVPEEIKPPFVVYDHKVGTGKASYTVRMIRFNSSPLVMILRNITNSEQFYGDFTKIRIPPEELCKHLHKIEGFIKQNDDDYGEAGNILVQFAAALRDEMAEVIERHRQLNNDGLVTYDTLWLAFQGARLIMYNDGDAVYCGEMLSFEYQGGWAARFRISVRMITSTGSKLCFSTRDFSIHPFKGTIKLTDLPARIATPADVAQMTERGRKFVSVAIGANYMAYTGHILVPNFWGFTSYKASGRIMVDIMNYDRNHGGNGADDDYNENVNNESKVDEVTEELLPICHPFVRGFSFASKKWGWLHVGKIVPIQWREDAFDKLVLDPRRKRLVKALVTNSAGTFSDIIAGKGGGCIFLLHGNPGVGKTLTCEAIAELLKRPLYSITVGELGVTPADLEKALAEILEMATLWNAVVLLDEADIFLEARTKQDIVRNAMVGIFLRLLEYHQGVLFLTTNRVENFDPAFHSRITIALKYEDLDQAARRQVWINLLDAAGEDISNSYIDELAKTEINGRQIKSAIRLAQTLSRDEGVPMNIDHIKETVNTTLEFAKIVGGTTAGRAGERV